MKGLLYTVLEYGFELSSLEISKILDLLSYYEGWEDEKYFIADCINNCIIFMSENELSRLTYEQIYEILDAVVDDWMSF